MKRLFLIFLFLGIITETVSQIPQTLSFQGVLIETADGQAANGTYTFKFNLFDVSTSGSSLWSEEHSTVQVEDGVYNVLLGSAGSPLNIPFDKIYYLEIAVSGGPTSIPEETLSPRIELATSGYELNTHLQDLADGSLSGSLIGTGINASNVTTGTLSGSLVGTGIAAGNITTGTINSDRLDADLQDLADGTLSDSKLETTIDRTIFKASDYITALGGVHVGGTSDPGTDNLVVDGTISGNGSGIANINGSNVATGTISDDRLETTINRSSFVATGDVRAGDDIIAEDDIIVQGEILPYSSSYDLVLKGTSIGPAMIIPNDAYGAVNLANWGNGYMMNLDHALADNGVYHYFIRFQVNSSTVGGIYETGSGNVVYSSFTGVHAGYTLDELNFGELVVADGTILKSGEEIGSEPIYSIRKSIAANSPYIIGSFSNKEDNLADSSIINNQVSIMSVGNGFMWVVDNGEDLRTGDYLISSDVAGHAMKDVGEYDIANIIARVGEDVIWTEVTDNIDGMKHKLINVFFENFIVNHKAERLESELEELKKDIAEIKALINLSN